MSTAIQTADLDWQCVDGIEIPRSKQFGDVYFSKDNGLLESRHVFLHGNDLPTRLAQLQDYEYFSVGETGFGTGLNILALWQLWQQVRPNNHSHLHAISVEKFPLTKADLIRALSVWSELEPISIQLIQHYPLAIAGCHRLSFPQERFSLDLWLGDAHDIFPTMQKTKAVNAWFLDGFAPSCNPEMWQDRVLEHLVRLSDSDTTFASFSVAGVLKRGLQHYGLEISRPAGFAQKRQMLKASWVKKTEAIATAEIHDPSTPKNVPCVALELKQRHIAIVGAGIAGLSCAWAFAQRGHQVTLYDQSAPLSGASGNPLALLNPKLSPANKAATHLVTASWQYALQHYQQFAAYRALQVNQLAQKEADEFLSLAEQYPTAVFTQQPAQHSTLKTVFDSLQLNFAAAIDPQQLKNEILLHPLIDVQITKIETIQSHDRGQLKLIAELELNTQFDHVIICAAQQSPHFFTNHPRLKPSRGQISWLNNQQHPLPLNQAYSYAGYCLQWDAQHLLLGASFYSDRTDDAVTTEDHVNNYDLIHSAFPEYAESLEKIENWQGRASIRVQSPDYFPLVGQLHDHAEIYTFTALGSKGFLFAPLCSEVLAALVLGEACPMSQALFQKINAKRFQKKVKPKKPYFKGLIKPS